MDLRLEAHLPERGKRRSITLACGCCCCCCCCLHTIGSTAMAGLGSITTRELTAKKSAEALESRGTAKKIYWLATLFLACTIPGGMVATESSHDLEEFALVSAIIVLLAMPLVQLGASLVSVVALALVPATVVPVRREGMLAIGRLTLFSVLGAVVGLGIMVPLLALVIH